jgi:integrase
MAYVFNRGTKDNPKLYGRYKDADDVWRMNKVPDEHALTKKMAERWIDEQQENVDAGRPDPRKAPTCGELIETWLESLTNRNAYGDRCAARKHLVPAFKDRRPAEIVTTDVVLWLDKLKKGKGKLSGGTQRGCLNLLSRFFGWAIARGYATINPVRQLQRGERPKQAAKVQDAPWIKDDRQVLAIAAALPSPLGIIYLVGNRCGLRPGEVAGLRISDLAELDHGHVRVRFHEDGPLKEDKGDGEAKVKWSPAPPDVQQILGSWVAYRVAGRVADEVAEEYAFPAPPNDRRKSGDGFYTKMHRSRAWRELSDELRGGCTWYEASRHSFASRNLEAGASLDEVSDALGHSTPAITKRHYARFIRKNYSAKMLGGLKLTDAKVIPFGRAAEN